MFPHEDEAEQRLFLQMNAPCVALDNKEANVAKFGGVSPSPEKLVEKIDPVKLLSVNMFS